ncbi:hypothetical protein M405DRAFT_545621, partial [Rhizopogon salebrosus TDB-379]
MIVSKTLKAKDPLSKFWASYQKVSSQYDDEMLERCNGNMDMVLIFACLFAAVNTAFIIAFQPSPRTEPSDRFRVRAVPGECERVQTGPNPFELHPTCPGL